MFHVQNRLYPSRDILKLILTSFCLTIVSLYGITMRHKIGYYIDFDKILLNSDYVSKTFVNYNDLFTSLETDIKEIPESLEEIDEANQHLDNFNDTEEAMHHHVHTVKYDNTVVAVEKILIDEDTLNNDKNIILSLNSVNNAVEDNQDDILWNTSNVNNDNQYILPIIDALEKNDTLLTSNRKIFKNDIAFLYQNRQKITMNVRKFYLEIHKDIAQLKASFKALNVHIPKKFLNLQTNIKTSKVLKKMNLTHQELEKNYPEFSSRLHELYKLRVFSSFLPLRDPVLNGRRSSGFGYRSDPFTKKAKMHSGLDFAVRTGTPLIASGSGVVKFAGVKSGYGNTIDIYHGDGIVSRYAHLSRISVKVGSRVVNGQNIGATGSTGRSTGPHLHYEIRLYNKPINPYIYINKYKTINYIINKY
jgi:murein DD-endopeptidase MepM/ murein hydrolase activator NlpD